MAALCTHGIWEAGGGGGIAGVLTVTNGHEQASVCLQLQMGSLMRCASREMTQ